MRFRFQRNVNRGAAKASDLHSIRRGKLRGGWGLLLFGMAFFAAGVAATWFLSLGVWQRVIDSANWREVPAVIVSSQVAVSRSSDSTNYRPDIVYRYSLDGREHSSDSWRYIRISSGRSWAEGIVAAYPPGSEHRAWVNPADPADAVLERKLGWWLLLTFIPLVFVVVGLGVAGFGLYGIARARKPAQLRKGDSLAGQSLRDFSLLGLPDISADLRQSGPVELKPEQGPLARLLGMAFFALFWNGVTWTLLGILISEGRRKDYYDWFPLLFLSFFAVMGAITVLAFLYYLYGFFFGPRMRLTASRRILTPGRPWELSWNFTRGINRVRELRMELEGCTEADFTRGSGKNSSRVTDRKPFYNYSIFSSRDAGEFLRGAAQVDLPADLPHSFAAKNNRICYRVRVTAVAACTPNLSQSFTVHVPPLANIHATS